MSNYIRHLISSGSLIKQALVQLDGLASDAILFVVDIDKKLIGSLTDGDIRRGLIKGFTIDSKIDDIIQDNPRVIRKADSDLNKVIEYRDKNFRIIPIVDIDNKVVNIINFREVKSFLPVDAVIMAGGRGQRLMPLTDSMPKPLLFVGEKPIIEHNIDRLSLFGINDFWISVNYLGDQIMNYFGDGNNKNISINYVNEAKPLGTIGAVSLISKFEHDYILVTNSDILTNIDYEQFFLDFINSKADFSVATIPYDVNVPYAILETINNKILSFKEKPTYTYFANAGIYLMKKNIIQKIPLNKQYNATDLMDYLINNNYNVHSYPLRGYWLDIGKHDDYNKAQEDINYIKF